MLKKEKNNDIVKKISELVVVGNRGKGRPMKKWIKVIEED